MRAARKAGSRISGKRWECLWVSKCEIRRPVDQTFLNCATASVSISAGSSFFLRAAQASSPMPRRNSVVRFVREGTLADGVIGSPSTSTRWQPTPSFLSCRERTQATASVNAAEFAINVAEVTTPRRLDSRMARLTPGVSPKSSALMIRRRTPQI